jgi:type II secretory pathway pseudopilin PulG
MIAPGPLQRRRAFSLLELLVVIGLIVLLTGAGALALAGRGGEGSALANAQSIVGSMVGAARAQAALHQTDARLVVYATLPPGANADAAKYLRTLQVVRNETPGATRPQWVAVGNPITLPVPVCIVPPAPVPVTHLNAGVTWNNNALIGPVSTLSVETGFFYRGQAAATATQFFGTQGQNGRIFFITFGPDGAVSSNASANPTKIALATAVLGTNAPHRFNNAFGVRGLFVRKSGALALVNETTAF